MNTDNSYAKIVSRGDNKDKEILYNLFKQKTSEKADLSSKDDIRKLLIIKFIDTCIFNEKNKSIHEYYKKEGGELLGYDNDYQGLRAAIFYLGLSNEQLNEIEEICITLAHKYYANDMKMNACILNDSPVENLNLNLIISDTSKLKLGNSFKWFNSDKISSFIFEKIENNKLFAKIEKDKLISWDHYESNLIYIEGEEKQIGTLGFLKRLKPYDCFKFKGGENLYTVISNENNLVKYRRLSHASAKDNPIKDIEQLDKKYQNFPNHHLKKVYESNGNIEVFDFLPF